MIKRKLVFSFIEKNWHSIVNTLGAILVFFIGRKTRKRKEKEADFLAYQTKINTYDLEFELKAEMLENLRKDYESRYEFLDNNLRKVEEQNKKLVTILESQSKIINQQNEIIANYELKFGKIA